MLITVVTFFFLSLAQAQTKSPKLSFIDAALVSGTNRQNQLICKLRDIASAGPFTKIGEGDAVKLVGIDCST